MAPLKVLSRFAEGLRPSSITYLSALTYLGFLYFWLYFYFFFFSINFLIQRPSSCCCPSFARIWLNFCFPTLKAQYFDFDQTHFFFRSLAFAAPRRSTTERRCAGGLVLQLLQWGDEIPKNRRIAFVVVGPLMPSESKSDAEFGTTNHTQGHYAVTARSLRGGAWSIIVRGRGA